MRASLHLQRCFNHAGREAVARCPECGRYYCRECVSEHEDRLLCAACLAKVAKKPLRQRKGFQYVARATRLVLGLLLTWLFFHWTAALLMRTPTDFHKGTLWKKNWLEE
jgi:hypothetical protein